MKIINKHVAVEPFKKEKVEEVQSRGLVLSQSSSALVSVKVVFDSGMFLKGDTLYFRPDVMKLPFANIKLSIEGSEFVLIPEDLVVGVIGRPVEPTPTPSNGVPIRFTP